MQYFRDPTWLQRRTAYGQSNAYLEKITKEKHSGNYTCEVENTLGTDKITYQIYVQGKTFLRGRTAKAGRVLE